MEKKESKQKEAKEEVVKDQKYKSITMNTLFAKKENPKKENYKNGDSKKENDVDNKDSELKDPNAIKLSDIINSVKDMPEEALEKEIENIKEDINNFNIKVGIDKSAIEILDELDKNENKESIKKLLASFTQTMSIDVNSMSELSSSQLKNVRSYCKVDKVYVNSGWDEGAKQGYEVEKYAKIRANADKMLKKALSKLPPNASEEQRFMALYNVVLKAERYDHQALNTSSPDYQKRRISSRNLEGFFLHGRSVCAGTADALKQLCECAGFEAEYVQGYAQSKWDKRNNVGPYYHAWMKVKIGDKWYNADPTWDANHAGKPYEYCLKSDSEFKNHNEDRSYNPTYRRNVKEPVRTTTRTYKSSTESMKTSSIKQYFNNKLYKERQNAIQIEESLLTEEERNALHYEMTEEDRKKLSEDYAPYTIGQTKKLTLKQRLANYFSKKGIFSKIFKKFIEKNKTEVEKKNVDMQSQNKSKSGMDEYKVDPEIAKYEAKVNTLAEKTTNIKETELNR